MFWFTTPNTSIEGTAQLSPIKQAVRNGAARSGVSFDYLVKTAERESSLNPSAKASTSSAKGLFQFIEQTWLSVVKDQGSKHGLSEYASAISKKSDGRLSVDDPELKEKILNLRSDPELSSVMAGEFTQKNKDHLSSALGRLPTDGELYAAHFLGAKGATDLVVATQADPSKTAASVFPDAAASNRAIFYDKSGRARALSEVYSALTAPRSEQTPPPIAPQDTAVSRTPTIRDNPNEPAMFGLFRTEGRRGPVSETVARMWTGQRAKGVEVASLGANPYFPRGDGDFAGNLNNGKQSSAIQPSAPASALQGAARQYAPSISQLAPFPPERPQSEAQDLRVKVRADQNGSDVSVQSSTVRVKARKPLDLSQFMVWR